MQRYAVSIKIKKVAQNFADKKKIHNFAATIP
jgi:hypothetical protein